MKKNTVNKIGLGLVEIIVAIGIVVTISVTAVSTAIHSFTINRLADDETRAALYAAEGLDGVRSIKNQSWTNISTGVGAHGLSNSGNFWKFSGSNNTSSIFTRTITIGTVQRNSGGSGDIVSGGGTVDADTMVATSSVTWNSSPTRSNSVKLTTYLTNFRKSLFSGDGIVIYGDTTTTPKYQVYTDASDTFGAQTLAATGASGLSFALRTSPTKVEAIGAYTTSGGVLRVMCFDGSSWSEDWTVSVGGTSTTRRFDIAYETNSGDVMVLYSTNAGTTNELAYRTKSGASACGGGNWAAATNLNPVRTSGVVQWVKMAWDRRGSSNLITAIWADANSDLSAMVWSGSAWGNEPSAASETSLEVVSAAQDVDDFDVEYESTSGDVMMVWANSAGNNGTNGVRYRTCTGGTSSCTWNAVTTPPTFSDDAHNLDISANPNTDEIVFASIGNTGDDLQIGYWSGSAWTDTANVDTSCENSVAGAHLVSTGWLINGATTRSIVVYNDNNSNNVDYYAGNGGTFTLQTDYNAAPALGDPQTWYQLEMDPFSQDRLMLVVADSNADLFAKRLTMTAVPAFTWTSSDGGAALETTLGQTTRSPFGFAYLRNP